MRNFLNRLAIKIQSFMYGRHGYDKLSVHLLWAAVIVYIPAMFVWRIPLSLIYLALIGYSIFRVFSKNNTKRYAELNAYNRFLGKIKGFFKLRKNKWRDRKTHVYFKCSCGAVLRVPKGKGEITVHCPKCKKSIDKRT